MSSQDGAQIKRLPMKKAFPCLESFQSDLQESMHQTDAQIFGKEKVPIRKDKVVLYNPLYWAAVLLSVPFLLFGRWVHRPCGQGGAVRDDESEVEYDIRPPPHPAPHPAPLRACLHTLPSSALHTPHRLCNRLWFGFGFGLRRLGLGLGVPPTLPPTLQGLCGSTGATRSSSSAYSTRPSWRFGRPR